MSGSIRARRSQILNFSVLLIIYNSEKHREVGVKVRIKVIPLQRAETPHFRASFFGVTNPSIYATNAVKREIRKK